MKKIKRYKGVSLVEMLITIVIVTVVVLLASITLTTLIRTSAVTTARTTARQESEFVMELVRRNLRNSHNEDIKLYNVTNRFYDENTGKLTDSGTIAGYSTPVGEGTVANEIHFRPNGYNRWVCIGYFPLTSDNSKGYFLKSSYPDNATPASCFDSSNTEYSQNAIVLNSSEVYGSKLDISYYDTPNGNKLMTVAVQMESIYDMSFSKNVKPVYYKQALISTQKLTWE